MINNDPSAYLARYLATTYRVFAPEDAIDLHVGQEQPALDKLLRILGANCWAFVTAWNPSSQPLAGADNQARQRTLVLELTAAGYACLAGVGMGADGWQEQSQLVLGMHRDAAITWGRRWGQNAVVWGEVGKAAELVWCLEPP